MKVVILCGGLGTRIRDVAEDIPKPMIRVGDQPIIWHLMRYYASFGHTEFVLCMGYKSEVIRNFFVSKMTNNSVVSQVNESVEHVQYGADDEFSNWSVMLANTGQHAMTGSRIVKVKHLLNNEPFMLTYGDGLSDINLDALLAHHQGKGLAVTVTGVRPPARFGELQVDNNGVATGFNEKPQASAGIISGGFFVCEPTVFAHMDDRDDLVFEQEPMKSLVSNQLLGVYQHDGFWQCMDTYRDWQLLKSMLDQSKAPWKIW
jgi:glucose-1-phosphate cytidylyltransferase